MDIRTFFHPSLGPIGTARPPGIFDSQNKTSSTTDTPQAPLAGAYAGFMTPDFEALKQITDPELRNIAMMDYIAKGAEQRGMDNSLKLIKALREQQQADRLKARPLEFQELVARNTLKTLTDLPGQIMRAGRMYDKEALEAGASLANRPGFRQTIRYFA